MTTHEWNGLETEANKYIGRTFADWSTEVMDIQWLHEQKGLQKWNWYTRREWTKKILMHKPKGSQRIQMMMTHEYNVGLWDSYWYWWTTNTDEQTMNG